MIPFNHGLIVFFINVIKIYKILATYIIRSNLIYNTYIKTMSIVIDNDMFK